MGPPELLELADDALLLELADEALLLEDAVPLLDDALAPPADDDDTEAPPEPPAPPPPPLDDEAAPAAPPVPSVEELLAEHAASEAARTQPSQAKRGCMGSSGAGPGRAEAHPGMLTTLSRRVGARSDREARHAGE